MTVKLNHKPCSNGCVDDYDDGCMPVCVASGCSRAQFDEVYFTVEGIRYDTLESANTIAKRIYKRYNQRNSINVMLVVVDKHGTREYDVVNYKAKKPALVECPDTVDMFA